MLLADTSADIQVKINSRGGHFFESVCTHTLKSN